MYGVVLIAVLAIMGGMIAYIGDKLGSKVGKRKLTIFGLRPKHTSILVTIVTGSLIASATLGVSAMVSSDVRTALFGMEALKEELSGLVQEVTQKNTELDENRAQLELKTKEYTTLNAKIGETATKLSKVTGELATVMAERDRTEAALENVQREYQEARGDLDQSRKEIDSLETTKTQLDSKVTLLNDSKNQLQTDVDRLNDLTGKLRKGIEIVREGVVVYQAGEVVSSAVAKGGLNQGETKSSLDKIIGNTNSEIINKLHIADKSLTVLWIGQADFDQAVDQLQHMSGQVIVRIIAAGNIIYGEPVIGRIEFFPNELIYSSGDTVYSETVEARSDANDAQAIVLEFLQKVNTEAVTKGMLPDPLQGSVGKITGTHLYETIDKVKHAGGHNVELSAVAKEDISTVGPLQIKIRVRELFQ